MDFSVAAPKVLIGQLKYARQTSSSQNSYTLSSTILFQRVWLQGILVSAPSAARLLLDDGSGLIEIAGDIRNRNFDAGAYLMVVGVYLARLNDLPILKVHKVVDLSMFPDREAMWYLEVVEAFKLFYQPITHTENVVTC